MAAAIHNIILEQGVTFSYLIKLVDINDDPINLTATTIKAQIRNRYDDVLPLATFDIIPVDLSIGEFTIRLLPSVTEMFDFEIAIWDMELEYNATTTDRVLKGSVELDREVTK